MTINPNIAKAALRIAKARTQLLLTPNFVFWATCALHLKLRPCKLIEQGAVGFIGTDGTSLFYDPDFIVEGLPNGLMVIDAATMQSVQIIPPTPPWSDSELMAVIAHEVSHAVKGDNWRRGSRGPRGWNIAADARINPELARHGLDMAGIERSAGKMASFLNNSANFGRSAEEIYAELPPGDGIGPGGQQGGGMDGDVFDPSADPTDPNAGAEQSAAQRQQKLQDLQQKWELIARQAAQLAKGQGYLPDGYEHLVEPVRPNLDPCAMLRHFVSMCRKDDYSWRRGNRRTAWRGLYLPSLYSEGVGELLIGADTSGSCDDVIPKWLGFLQSVLDEVKPERVIFLECDVAVHRSTVFEQGEGLPQQVPVSGYGGTSMRPIWEWAEERNVVPVCAIVLTDLEMTDHALGDPQPFPVLWVTNTPKRYAPWGETVFMKE